MDDVRTMSISLLLKVDRRQVRLSQKSDAKDITELPSETVRKESLQTNKGDVQNVFQRSAGGEERDGHFARLEGILKLNSFLQKVRDKATPYRHGKVS